jgi:hypothetical protein
VKEGLDFGKIEIVSLFWVWNPSYSAILFFLTGVSQFLCTVYVGGTAVCVVRLNLY